jgi:uncharacterized protein (DUF1330 family)
MMGGVGGKVKCPPRPDSIAVTDPDRFTKYFQVVMPVIERRGGRLVAQGTVEVIEGTLLFRQAVLFEWRSRNDLLEYWHSDEYAKIKKLREGAAELQAVVIKGIHPDPQNLTI